MGEGMRCTVVMIGYRKEDGCASGTVTLFEEGDRKILVDCGDPGLGKTLVSELAKYGCAPDEVTDVVITHPHLDHCGNLSLFPRATIYMDTDKLSDGKYSTFEDETQLTDHVRIAAMRGHTARDLVVIAEPKDNAPGWIVATGDLFENDHDEDTWRSRSAFPVEHGETREKIRKNAGIIIPGHANMFYVE